MTLIISDKRAAGFNNVTLMISEIVTLPYNNVTLIISENLTCSSAEFRCESDARCIPARWQCDGENDCDDKSDESVKLCGEFFWFCDFWFKDIWQKDIWPNTVKYNTC